MKISINPNVKDDQLHTIFNVSNTTSRDIHAHAARYCKGTFEHSFGMASKISIAKSDNYTIITLEVSGIIMAMLRAPAGSLG